MADENTPNAAGATPATGPSQPAGGGADFVQVPRSEYDKLTRYGDQVKGFQPFHQKASAYGFKSADDFDRYDPWLKQIQTLQKRGVQPDMIGRMFSEEADADLAAPEHKNDFDPVRFRQEIESGFEKKLAAKEWETMTAKEKDYVDGVLRDFFGSEEVDEMTKTTYKLAVERFLDQNRELYPENHPLYSTHLKPHDESIAKKAVEYFKGLKSKSKGAAMANKADAVIASEKKPPSAGRSGGNGAPNTTPPEKRPYGKPSRETVEAAHKAKMDARGRGAT